MEVRPIWNYSYENAYVFANCLTISLAIYKWTLTMKQLACRLHKPFKMRSIQYNCLLFSWLYWIFWQNYLKFEVVRHIQLILFCFSFSLSFPLNISFSLSLSLFIYIYTGMFICLYASVCQYNYISYKYVYSYCSSVLHYLRRIIVQY